MEEYIFRQLYRLLKVIGKKDKLPVKFINGNKILFSQFY